MQPTSFSQHSRTVFGGAKPLVRIGAHLLLLISCAGAYAQQTARPGAKPDGAHVYPYVLSVDPGGAVVEVNGTYRLPVLHYRKIAATTAKTVMIRAAWNTQDDRTECNAGTEPITLVAQSGAWKPDTWGDALGLLLSAFGVKGIGVMSFALFDHDELSRTEKNKIAPETARLSVWLKAPAKLK